MCYTWSMRSIPQRTFWNDIARILREVEAGERLQVTVDGRPVAELVPIDDFRRTFVPRRAVINPLQRTRLGADFQRDIDAATGAGIDKL